MIEIKQQEILQNAVKFTVKNFTGVVCEYNIVDGHEIELKNADINKVLNELLHQDDLEILIGFNKYIFKKSNFNYRLTENEIRRFRYIPYAHQVEAINFGLKQKHSKWLLLDGMG